MRTVTKHIKLRTFDELSPTSQTTVIIRNEDINIDGEWWDTLYEDAANIGLRIDSSSVDGHRQNGINCGLSIDAVDSITKILADHGDTCETHKLATEYKGKFDAMNDASPMAVEMARTDVAEEYQHKLGLIYLDMLRQDYDDRCSHKQVAETLRANEYEFDEKGNIWTDKD